MDAIEAVFELLKALGREEIEPAEFSEQLRDFMLDDVVSGMNAFADVFGLGVPADAIELADLPVEIDEAASMFVAIDWDDRCDDFAIDW